MFKKTHEDKICIKVVAIDIDSWKAEFCEICDLCEYIDYSSSFSYIHKRIFDLDSLIVVLFHGAKPI